jgi:hypothetical protein
MQSKCVSRFLNVAMPVVVSCVLAAASAWAWANDDDRRDQDRGCSNQTLHGDYGFSNDGLLFFPDGSQATLRGVVMEHFDGYGRLTTADHTVVGGVPPTEAWRPGSGTYTVNPDCTGTQTINIPSSPAPPLVLYFVVVRQGREIRQVVEGNAIISIGKKVR